VTSNASVSSTTPWWDTPGFVRSLPLFVLAGAFFVAGGVVRLADPKYALYGPGFFTFWALLLALGFTCAIGAVVSWTLAADPAPPSPEAPARTKAPAYLPIDFPDSAPHGPAAEPVAAARAREEFGRPAPAVRPMGAAAEWYEAPTDSEHPGGPVPLGTGPVGSGTTSVTEPDRPESSGDSEAVQRVLADLEQIERELAPRARATEPSPA
jgi:hypothetical protein